MKLWTVLGILLSVGAALLVKLSITSNGRRRERDRKAQQDLAFQRSEKERKAALEAVDKALLGAEARAVEQSKAYREDREPGEPE